MKKVAIIGCGSSGLITAYELVRRYSHAVEIDIIEKEGIGGSLADCDSGLKHLNCTTDTLAYMMWFDIPHKIERVKSFISAGNRLWDFRNFMKNMEPRIEVESTVKEYFHKTRPEEDFDIKTYKGMDGALLDILSDQLVLRVDMRTLFAKMLSDIVYHSTSKVNIHKGEYAGWTNNSASSDHQYNIFVRRTGVCTDLVQADIIFNTLPFSAFENKGLAKEKKRKVSSNLYMVVNVYESNFDWDYIYVPDKDLPFRRVTNNHNRTVTVEFVGNPNRNSFDIAYDLGLVGIDVNRNARSVVVRNGFNSILVPTSYSDTRMKELEEKQIYMVGRYATRNSRDTFATTITRARKLIENVRH